MSDRSGTAVWVANKDPATRSNKNANLERNCVAVSDGRCAVVAGVAD